MTVLSQWLEALAYTDFPEALFTQGAMAGTRSYANEIEEMLSPDRGIGAAAVFCVDELPTVCIIDVATLGADADERIENIRQRVWNQNLASVVLVLSEDSAAAYSVSDREALPDSIDRATANRSGNWSAYEVQSGFIKDRLSEWFQPEERVDQRLLSNLRQVVNRLARSGLKEAEAEALMAQVIFLCYLEQRGIVGDAYRAAHDLSVLDAYVSANDGAGIDRLLKQLGSDFNGDFLRGEGSGAPLWSTLSSYAFRYIKLFLDAVDFETGQGSFWHYDFSHIPVELISGIYETLLKERQGKLGAYYTPRHLANLVTDQAFERFADKVTCSVYDGACGSGILLTTAYRKMLRRAEVHNGGPLRFSRRVELMKSCIFGNDVDETACWITAFSLYLSLLEGLDEVDIGLLQTDDSQKLPELIGPGRNIQKGEASGDFFSSANPFAGKGRFDIFLCNPPWRESDNSEQPTWEAWCRSQVPAYPIGRRQIAAGFAYRAMQSVNAGGVVALIMPLNLIVGATQQSCDFRQRMLSESRIDRIINFADVRRLLFPAAKHPCAVLIARPRPKTDVEIPLSDELVEYWAPKTDVSLALGRLAMHEIDRKSIPAWDIYDKPYILISSYWGERRDISLLRRLERVGTLGKTMSSRSPKWISGKGFHAANNSNPDKELGGLAALAFLGSDRIPLDHNVIGQDTPLEDVREHHSIVASIGGRGGRLYSGPRAIFPDGLSESYTVRAIFSERAFAFSSSVGAIGGGKGDADLVKFLANYLRSPLVSFLLIMTGYSVIGERPRVAIDDIESFPFCAPEDHVDPVRAKEIIKQVALLTDAVGNIPEFQRGHSYAALEGSINELIYEYFSLTDSDRLIVKDMVEVIATSIQPGDYEKLNTPLLHRPLQSEFDAYVEVLSSELASWRSEDRGRGFLEVDAFLDQSSGFFGAVRVRLSKTSDAARVTTSRTAFEGLLRDLTSSMNAHSAALGSHELFKVPNIMVFADDAFYFVKPMRRRFWLARAALADADHILQTIQAANWGRAYS